MDYPDLVLVCANSELLEFWDVGKPSGANSLLCNCVVVVVVVVAVVVVVVVGCWLFLVLACCWLSFLFVRGCQWLSVVVVVAAAAGCFFISQLQNDIRVSNIYLRNISLICVITLLVI